MPVFKLLDGTLNYKLSGNGLPLTLIHGVGADMEIWDSVISHFQNSFQILRMDLRGHGESAKTPGPYSLELFSNDLLALLNHVGFDQTHLVGFSLGGLIAQRFAIDHAQRLHSLSIISSVAGRTEEEKQRVRERAANLKEGGAVMHLANAVDRWFTDEFIRSRPEILEWRKQKSLQNNPETYAAAHAVLANSDLADELALIECPTLAMTGENDIGSTPRMTTLIAERTQNGRSIILPKLKHSVLLEAPKLIAQELDTFISAVPTLSGH